MNFKSEKASQKKLKTTVKVFGNIICTCGNKDLNKFSYIKVSPKFYCFKCDNCGYNGDDNCKIVHDSPDIAYIRLYNHLFGINKEQRANFFGQMAIESLEEAARVRNKLKNKLK